jgi:hypothetical protein
MASTLAASSTMADQLGNRSGNNSNALKRQRGSRALLVALRRSRLGAPAPSAFTPPGIIASPHYKGGKSKSHRVQITPE